MNNKKILLVEDDDISQFLIKKMLENLSLDVTIVSNGIEALSILSQEKFHLILMDIEMPVISGYETIRRIQKNLQQTIQQRTIQCNSRLRTMDTPI